MSQHCLSFTHEKKWDWRLNNLSPQLQDLSGQLAFQPDDSDFRACIFPSAVPCALAKLHVSPGMNLACLHEVSSPRIDVSSFLPTKSVHSYPAHIRLLSHAMFQKFKSLASSPASFWPFKSHSFSISWILLYLQISFFTYCPCEHIHAPNYNIYLIILTKSFCWRPWLWLLFHIPQISRRKTQMPPILSFECWYLPNM